MGGESGCSSWSRQPLSLHDLIIFHDTDTLGGTLARPNEKWLEVAKDSLPCRLSLRSLDASNLGDVARHLHCSGPSTGCDGKKGDRDHCLGRSRGGLTTKIHALVDAKGMPIKLMLTVGQMSDIASAGDLIRELPEGAMLLADKGYDSNALRSAVTE